MPEIRPGSYARHPELGTVKILDVGADFAEVSADSGDPVAVPIRLLTLDPIDTAEQAADNA
jgi:hypothetical protein